jgi:quercetin dioxygenase-like cupin family protein
MAPFESAQLEEAWIEGDDSARWRSGPGPTELAEDSGSSLLEVRPGNRLPVHTDSAEETIVVITGAAAVAVAGERFELGPGGVGVIPANAPHEVACTGNDPLRFVAVYAGSEVVTTYEEPVQPEGEKRRKPFG